MEIHHPQLRVSEYWIMEYARLFSNFAKTYNEGKPSKEQLGTPHLNLYLLYVEVANAQMKTDYKSLDDKLWFSIQGTAILYAYRNINTRESSVIKWSKELEHAGVISRDQKLFLSQFNRKRITTEGSDEILINPDFLLIYDNSNPDHIPDSYYWSLSDHEFMKNSEEEWYGSLQDVIRYPIINKFNEEDFIINR